MIMISARFFDCMKHKASLLVGKNEIVVLERNHRGATGSKAGWSVRRGEAIDVTNAAP
jgi:hypothetical protein